MRRIVLLLLCSMLVIISLSLTSAEVQCSSILGCRIVTGNVTISNVDVNNSQYLLGSTWSNAPYPFLGSCPYGVMNVTIGGLQCLDSPATGSTFNATYNTWLPNYTLYNKFWYNGTEGAFQYINSNITAIRAYVDAVVNGNITNVTAYIENYTYNKVTIANMISGNLSGAYTNGTGLRLDGSQFNLSLDYTDNRYASIIWGYNQTYSGSTFNATYNAFTGVNNASIWNGINQALAGSNSSFNQSLTDTLYAPISLSIWGYNQTLSAINDINSRFWNRTQSYNNTEINSINNSLANFISINTSNIFVPYTGAKNNIDSGVFNFTATWFKGMFNWVIGNVNSGAKYLNFNGTDLNFNESILNVTIGQKITEAGIDATFNKTWTAQNFVNSSNSTLTGLAQQNSSLWAEAQNKFNATYNQWAYNQTTFALTYTNTVNNSLASYIGTNTSNTYVPYVGASKNVNIANFNFSRTNFSVYDNGTCGVMELGGLKFYGC